MTGDIESATKMTALLHTVLIMAHYGFEHAWKNRFETQDISKR